MDTHIEKYNLEINQVAIASEVLKLVSDPTRLKICWTLLHNEHSVNELAKHINAQPAAVSQHLAKLRIAGLVKVSREGNKMIYAIDNKHVYRLIEQALQHADYVIKRG